MHKICYLKKKKTQFIEKLYKLILKMLFKKKKIKIH